MEKVFKTNFVCIYISKKISQNRFFFSINTAVEEMSRKNIETAAIIKINPAGLLVLMRVVRS